MEMFFAWLAEHFDLPILLWIREHIQCAFGDAFFPVVTLFGEYGIFFIATALVLIIIPKTRRTGLALGASLALGLLLCNCLVKPLCYRIRPFTYVLENYGIDIPILTKKYTDGSFPSGHAVACVEAATALMLSDKRFGIPAVVIAVLVSFSRLYLFVHYPTDVIAGIIMGIVVGFLAVFIVRKGCDAFEAKTGKHIAP